MKDMPCGHPLTARMVAIKGIYLVTECWACNVQRELISKIVGPARAKAEGDTK